MTGTGARKFWAATSVVPAGAGFTIHLDDRPLRTPARAPFVVPVADLAHAVAAEWEAQDAEIRPETMPFTRICNAAIDNMGAQRAAVIEMLAEYGATDLTCYRADSPAALAERQAAGWDEILDWLSETKAVRLIPAIGVLPVAQDAAGLAKLRAWIAAIPSDFAMMALHDLVTISGSLVLAIAVVEGRLSAAEGWALSRIDETWQAEQWGEDAEAMEAAAVKQADFLRAATVMAMLRGETP